MKIEKCKLQIEEQSRSITLAGETMARPRRRTCPRLIQFAFFIFQFSIFNMYWAPAFAGYDSEADKPYKVQLVLRFAEHKQCTPTFKDKVERELPNSLQGALGEMREVDVVRDHAKLKQIDEQRREKLLDSCPYLTRSHTHSG